MRQENSNFLEPLSFFCNTNLNTPRFNMTSGLNKIDNKSYEQILITQYMIDYNRQASDEKMKKYYSKLD